jgi:hypothetical protein
MEMWRENFCIMVAHFILAHADVLVPSDRLCFTVWLVMLPTMMRISDDKNRIDSSLHSPNQGWVEGKGGID